MRALIDEVSIEYCVAPSHVYAVGSSSSAGKVADMAQAPDVIAATAVGLEARANGLEPKSPVPVLAGPATLIGARQRGRGGWRTTAATLSRS